MAQVCICVPVIGTSVSGILLQVSTANKVADLIELRLDYSYPLSENELRQIIEKTEKPLILTCRMEKEGGKFKGTEKERAEYLGVVIRLAKHKDLFADMELDGGDEFKAAVLKFTADAGAKLIVSKHFFTSTPAPNILEKTLQNALEYKPFAVKIAAFAKKPEHNLRILEFLKKHKADASLICFCMGDLGKESRINCALNGNYLNYASLDGKTSSAPGQIDAVEFRKILSEK